MRDKESLGIGNPTIGVLHIWIALASGLLSACAAISATDLTVPYNGRNAPDGFEGDHWETLEEIAAKKLECDTIDLRHQDLGEKIHRMSGCGKSASFYLWDTGLTDWVGSPMEAASFDLNCPEAELQLKGIGNHQFGVVGCGGRARYLLSCPDNEQCVWIVNQITLPSGAGESTITNDGTREPEASGE